MKAALEAPEKRPKTAKPKRPNPEPSRQRNRLKKQRAISNRARDATLSIKCNSGPGYVRKITTPTPPQEELTLTNFTNTFFNTKHLPEYSRLPPHSKLLLSQWVLHNDQRTKEQGFQPFPFVYRSSIKQRELTEQQMDKKIFRKLQAALNRPVWFWTTSEFDDKKTQIMTHRNGEILITPNEYVLVLEAFKQLFGKEGLKFDAYGTITKNSGIGFAIRLPMKSRIIQAERYGWFYSVFNWVGYATKQNQIRDGEAKRRKISRLEPIAAGKCHYIAAKLNQEAAKFYNEQIRKSK